MDSSNTNYFLISGTLLGYVRHNGFIPWDDDMDLLVDNNIADKLPNIINEHPELIFVCHHGLIKICFKNQGISVPGREYNWPFVDLFQYSISNNHIRFFNRNWSIKEFLPIQKVNFLDMQVSIPKNPSYFLKRNYGADYMIKLRSSNFSHKNEYLIKETKTIYYENFEQFKGKN